MLAATDPDSNRGPQNASRRRNRATTSAKLRGRLFQISASCEDDRLVARPARAGGAPGALPARARGARQARSWRALGALPARGRRAHGARPVRAGCAPGSRPARARCASGACPAPRPVVKINVIPYKVVEKPKKSLNSTSFNIKIQWKLNHFCSALRGFFY